MREPFKPSALTFKDDTEAERKRTFGIFVKLIEALNRNDKLSECEKDFVFQGIRLNPKNGIVVSEYPQLENAQFKFLYLIYFSDLTGGSRYFKPNPKTKKCDYVEISEAQLDLKFLLSKAKEWLPVLETTNHRNQLLQTICSEARTEIKKLRRLPQFHNNPIAKGSFDYKFKLWGLAGRFRYTYHFIQELFERNNDRYYCLNLFNEEIRLTEHSYVHVTNRHYSRITKSVDLHKSFHADYFEPRTFHLTIQDLFDVIGESP